MPVEWKSIWQQAVANCGCLVIICQIVCRYWYTVDPDSGGENPEIENFDITILEGQPANPHVGAEKDGETLKQDDIETGSDGKSTVYLR